MSRPIVARAAFAIDTVFLLLTLSPYSPAQSTATCHAFGNPHDALDCVEGLFSHKPYHLTFSSLAPGNGFPLGVVAEQTTHYVSPFATPWIAPRQATGPQPDAYEARGTLSLTDAKLALAGSENGSWMATGSLTWLPRGYTPGHHRDHQSCNRLGFLCTKAVAGLHFEGTHRSLQTLSFYGLGPASPPIKHTFHQDDTYGIARGRLPLTEWMNAEAGFEYRQTTLPATTDPLSVDRNFTTTDAPGLFVQPAYVHPHLALSVHPIVTLERATDDQDLNREGPLMKSLVRFTFNNSAEYHWYVAQGNPDQSFQQFRFRGDEAVQLGSRVRRLVYASDHRAGLPRLWYNFLSHECGEDGPDPAGLPPVKDPVVLKVRHPCDYGRIDFQSQWTLSHTATGATVPFYLQPTVGGSDINSETSLRGFPDYRFRGRDAAVVQVDYSEPVYDAFGLLLFYDAGTVSQTPSALSFAHLRQDGGIGATFSVQGGVVAQTFLAWGAGHGPTLGYNFTKFF